MGLTFRGQHSDEFQIAIKTEDIPGLANKRHEIHTVPGRNGGYVVEDGYFLLPSMNKGIPIEVFS